MILLHIARSWVKFQRVRAYARRVDEYVKQAVVITLEQYRRSEIPNVQQRYPLNYRRNVIAAV